MSPGTRRAVIRIVVWLLIITGVVAVVRKPIKKAFFEKEKTVSTGRFQDPEGLAVDREGNFYVADEDLCRLYMLDKTGKIVAEARELPGYPNLTTGDSIAVIEPRHIIIISSHYLLELKVVGPNFEVIRQFGQRGRGEEDFEDPEGLSIDRSNGDVYATDEDNRRVKVFSKDGKFLRNLKMEHDPESVFVFEDRVYVTMSKAGWVGCYRKDGTNLFKFGHKELIEPDCVTVSPDRKVYVTDQKGNRIQVFDLDGKFLFGFGKFGRGPGEFDQPEDLAWDPDGNLIVADGDNHRIQVLTPDGKPIRVIQ
jgi:tripartite motif-containing protein 71